MSDMGNIRKEITIPNRIFLKGFSPATSEEDLENIFKKYGSIIETNIIWKPRTGQRYAFITFDSQQVAENVINNCKSVELDGTEVTVAPAKIRRDRTPNKARYGSGTIYNNSNLNQHSPPRIVSVPYTVQPDGLFTFHQPMVPVCLPVESNGQVEGEGTNVANSVSDAYPSNPDHNATSKSEKCLPTIDNVNRHEKKELPHANRKSPAKVTSDYDRPSSFNPIDTNRKTLPVNNYGGPTNQLPAIFNNQYENVVNRQVSNQVEQKTALTTTNIHLPNINGHLTPNSYGPHPMNNNLDVTILNGNMAYQCIPFATIIPPEWNQVDPGYLNPEPRKINFPVPSSMQNRSVPNRMSNSGSKMNGDPPLNCTNLKGQQYVFMSTGPGKVKRVIVQ